MVFQVARKIHGLIAISFSNSVDSILYKWNPFKLEQKDELDQLEVQLEKLKSLLDRGIISEEEYETMRKNKLGL